MFVCYIMPMEEDVNQYGLGFITHGNTRQEALIKMRSNWNDHLDSSNEEDKIDSWEEILKSDSLYRVFTVEMEHDDSTECHNS